MLRRTSMAAVVLGLLAGMLVGCARYRPPADCTTWRYGPADEPAPGVVPSEYPRTEAGWKLGSLRDDDPVLRSSLHNQCGQVGAAVDLAWGVTKGRDDVVIAVLDSGIKWRSAGDMADLATKAFLNRGELSPPCSAPSGDCNGDGRFDVADFAGSGNLPDRNGNGLADPEDLILDPANSDGVDDDGNGYVDDISGWDFLYGDNNPLDTVDYGHGTGEAKDSTAAANGSGGVGTCPNCRFLPVRVSDSFIAEGGRFAAGVLFALDNGADVVQEALGVTSNPRQAQQAVDAAYERGVVVVASMADEESKHANLPAALERTMPVNSVTQREHSASGASDGWLALNGCTNWGAITWVAVPSSSCSSEATGLGAGMVGLVESAAREAGIAPHPGLPAGSGGPGGDVLSANEVMQLVAANADDIDFATPNATEPANDYGGSTGDLVASERYPSRQGWDQVYGYGRINAYEAVRLTKAGAIPPEADLASPQRFAVLPTTGSLPVTGTVAARFATSYGFRVEWAPGASPPAHPGTDQWRVVAQRTGLTAPVTGELGRIDLAQVAAALPGGGSGPPVADAPGAKPDEDRFAVRVRVVATGEGGKSAGLVGRMQKQIYVHADPDLVAGFPRAVAGASTSSPVFANLDGQPGDELVVATSDGEVHAFRANGTDAPGWPGRTSVAPWWPTGSPTAAAEGIAPQRSALMVGAPAIADIDGNGSLDVVATDDDGSVWAWNAQGQRLAGFGETTVEGRPRGQVHVDLAFSRDSRTTQNPQNRTKPGIVGAAALGNLDADPQLEIVAGAMDRHVYAWNHDGTPVAGWPVLLVDPATVQAVDATSHAVTFTDATAQEGGEIIATPALADLTGDGRDEVVIGGQESYAETPNVGDSPEADLIGAAAGGAGNTRLYVLSSAGRNAGNPDRSAAHPDDTAYRPGWPVKVSQLLLGVLPTIGDGMAAQAAVGDVVPGNPGPEIVANSPGGPVHVYRADGTSALGVNPSDGRYNPAAWSGGFLGQNNGRFGASRNSQDIVLAPAAFSGPAIGLLDADAVRDFAAPTAGYTRLVDLLAPDQQQPSDDQLMAWKGGDAPINALPGFPQVTSDIAFFMTPAIADLDGDGKREVIAGNGVAVVGAHEADGARPAGWPKLQGGWVIGTPGLGDLDGDGKAEIAIVRRDGTLFVWRTQQPAAGLDQWPRFGGNGRNNGRPAS